MVIPKLTIVTQRHSDGDEVTIGHTIPKISETPFEGRWSTRYESGGKEFESLRARHLVLACEHPDGPFSPARTAFSRRSLLPFMRISPSSTSMALISDCKYDHSADPSWR